MLEIEKEIKSHWTQIGFGVVVRRGVGVGVDEALTVNVITACEGPCALSPSQSILSVCVPAESFAVSVPERNKLPEDAEHEPDGLIFHVPPAALLST